MTERNPEDLDPTKVLQFSLQRLLLITTLVAIGLAFAGPWLRQFSPRPVAYVIGASILGIVLWWGNLLQLSARLRRAHSNSGDLVMAVSSRPNRWRYALLIASSVILIVPGCQFTYYFLRDSTQDMPLSFSNVMCLAFVCLSVINVLSYSFFLGSRPHIFFYDKGILVGVRLIYWKKVANDRWHRDKNGQFWLELRSTRWRLLKLHAHKKDIQAINDLLNQVRSQFEKAVRLRQPDHPV